MSAQVALERISRAQLESLVLHQQGFIKDLLRAVRAGTKTEWKVRKDIEDLAAAFQSKRLEGFREIYVEQHLVAEKAARNTAYWQEHFPEARVH